MPARYDELPGAQTPDPGIEAIWHSRTDRAGNYRVLPDGRCDLILRFQIGKDGLGPILPILTGPSPRFHDVELIPGNGFVGARFKPGHALRFLGISPQVIPAEGCRGQQVLDLCPQIHPLVLPASSQTELITRMNRFLGEQARDRPPPSPQIRAIAGAFHAGAGRLSVAEIAAMHAITPRQLTRIWRQMTGFAPKNYAMILQFQQALRLMEQTDLSASDAAFEAGYADQAHMSRAFLRFGGFSPARRMAATLVTLRA